MQIINLSVTKNVKRQLKYHLRKTSLNRGSGSAFLLRVLVQVQKRLPHRSYGTSLSCLNFPLYIFISPLWLFNCGFTTHILILTNCSPYPFFFNQGIISNIFLTIIQQTFTEYLLCFTQTISLKGYFSFL